MDLAREQGVPVTGADANADIVAAARSCGFEIVHDGTLAVLDGKPAGSVGVITAFHLIEHLSASQRLRFFMGASRALCARGFLLLEWPNIENPRVAHYTFWLDPTHGSPLPAELAVFMARYAGFTEVMLNRIDDGQPVGFEAADLGLWARKP